MGIVYLDRKLPFDPLPLGRFRLDGSWLNREVTISGWGANVATGPTTGTGGREQRTGRSRLLGSPTAADYHPEDPNPGLLVPANRSKIIKIDGRAPYSNACFGDSGGPLLVSQYGQTYIAGVEYFGGLYCEDYSLYTRIDPFLPFFDEAYRKGGQAVVTPAFDCVTSNADGSLTAFFGYQNQNGVNVTVPFGAKNTLALDTGGLRPTLFKHGTHHFVFGVDFTPNQTIRWKLSPENSPTTTLTVNKSSRRCGAADQPSAVCGQSCRAQLRSGCTGLQPYEACIGGCTGFYEIFEAPQCNSYLDQWNACFASTPPGAANWQCFPESSPGAGDGQTDAPPARLSSTRSSSARSAAEPARKLSHLLPGLDLIRLETQGGGRVAGVGTFTGPGVTFRQPHRLAIAVTLAKARVGPVLFAVTGYREPSRRTRQLQLTAIDTVHEICAGRDELQRHEAELL